MGLFGLTKDEQINVVFTAHIGATFFASKFTLEHPVDLFSNILHFFSIMIDFVSTKVTMIVDKD